MEAARLFGYESHAELLIFDKQLAHSLLQSHQAGLRAVLDESDLVTTTRRDVDLLARLKGVSRPRRECAQSAHRFAGHIRHGNWNNGGAAHYYGVWVRCFTGNFTPFDLLVRLQERVCDFADLACNCIQAPDHSQFKARIGTDPLREVVMHEIDRQIEALPGASIVQKFPGMP